MNNVSAYSADRRRLAGTPATSIRRFYKSETRVDIAVLICVLFVQRFGLEVGKSILPISLVLVTLIFVHQFASGRLLIQYDRLLWFLAVMLTATFALLTHFNGTMLSSYGLFLVIYFLFTLTHTSTADLYKSTLRGFQLLALILACLGIAQFVAQFVVDGRRLIQFFGIFPEFLFAAANQDLANTIIPITQGSSLIKSNGIFLSEPSYMSQTMALGILIEVLEFRRPRYLLLLALGLLLSYSGTGIGMLLVSLPLAALVDRRAQLPALLISFFALALLATGIIDLSVFTSRIDEFGEVRASGFLRFIAPFWMAAEHFDTASLPALLVGYGPGTADGFAPRGFYYANGSTWFKLLYEYGLIGAFIFTCFLRACFRRSRCPKPIIAALIYNFVIGNGYLLNPAISIIMVVLCTLSGPKEGRSRRDGASGYLPFVASPS